MRLVGKFFGTSPFKLLVEHTREVHECVKLVKPLTDALVAGNYDKIETLHHEMSRMEHEADVTKAQIRENLSKMFLLSVGRYELDQFLSLQDNVADAAEDYAVVLLLRKTEVPPEVTEDFMAFVNQVVLVSEHLLSLAEELALLAEAAFTGAEAERVLESIDKIGGEEWKADKLQRKFARSFYAMEDQLEPITIFFLDKYSHTLSEIANTAEKAGKFLRRLIVKR
jgi:predicted phosphate transport protein (TIGR00153 family)